MPDATKVTTGKPKVGGAVHRAPVGSTLPTSADTALDNAFAELGYLNEDGLTNSNSIESESIKAWGGDEVLNVQTDRTDTFHGVFIEAMNLEVLKMVYGESNVTGSLATGITVTANKGELGEHAYVFDMILKGNTLKRVVIPRGTITEIGDVVYKDDETVGYEVTISAAEDNSGNTHYEYIKAAS